MRKVIAIISGLILAATITIGVLFYQGNPFLTDLVENWTKSPLPTLEEAIEQEEKEEEELNLSYEERIEKGDYYFERGFLTFATNEYVRASNLEPTRTEPYQKLVETHFELGNYNKALSSAEFILEKEPGNLETRFDTILIHMKLSDFDTAKNLLSTFPTQTSSDAKVNYYKGLLSSVFGSYSLAKQELQTAKGQSLDPQLTEKIDIILGAYAEFDATQAGEELFRSILLARAYNKVGEYEAAIHTLKDTLKTRADLRDGWILLSFAYLNLEKYQFALTAIDKAYSLDSTWSTTQYFLGLIHKELGNFEDSIVYFNLALSNDFEPKIVIQSQLAELYFDSKDFENAAEAYEAVLAIDQENVAAYIRPVWLYIDYVKDPEKALNIAKSALAAFPDSAMSYNLMGWSYIGLEDLKRAESHLKKALEIDPLLPAAHLNIGSLYELQSKESQALAAYQEAYRLDESGSIGNLAGERYNELIKKTSNE